MSEKITFAGASGDQLVGRVQRPAGTPAATALFAHCFTCSKDLRAAREVTRALANSGFLVLRFDFTGLGESAGDFADTNFSSNVEDLVAAAAWLEAHHQAPALLVGHSLGGAAVISAARRIPSSKAVVTIGAPSDPSHVLQHLDGVSDELAAKGVATVELAGRSFTVKQQLVEDIERQRLQQCLHDLHKALLILHSPQDTVVGIDHARHIYQAARHPKSFVTLDGADHLLSDASDARYAGRIIGCWASRYLPAPATERPEHDLVEVRIGRDHYHADVLVRGHRLPMDEPEPQGTDSGPTPYELLVAALGGCTGITLRMYADRKGWPLDGVRTVLTHAQRHVTDCEGCEDKPKKIDVIERRIELIGDLDAQMHARLMQIADRCPVHRTLHNEIRIETSEADAG